MGFNPCICWNLKDGCVTVGIWSLIFAISQMGIFGWQTAVIKWYKDRAHNTLLPEYGSYQSYENRWPGYYERTYESPKARFYTGLFVVQILNLIGSFFLLFASVSLIYGIHTNSRYLVWPWFPCIVTSILCSIAYCVTWWLGDLTSYWLVLTMIEILTVLVNLYCLLCVLIQYRRIVSGSTVDDAKSYNYYYDEYGQPKGTVVKFTNGQSGFQTTTSIRPGDRDGQYNLAYDADQKYGQIQVQNGLHAEELPTKSMPIEAYATEPGQPNQAATMHEYPVEQWLQGVEQPTEPILEDQGPHTEPASPTKLGQDEMALLKHAKSVPSVLASERERKSHRHHHHHHRDRNHRKDRHRTTSVDSRSYRSKKSSRSDSSDNSYDSDDVARKSRDGGGDRRRHRTRSRGGGANLSDSDTGYSRSERSGRHHRRHGDDGRHRRRGDDEQRGTRSGKRHRRPREVKREDKERSGRDAPVPPHQAETLTTPTTDQPSLNGPQKYSPVPLFPPPGPGGITIPQHIVIPPTAIQQSGRNNQPQRFHINSEITISYSDKSSGAPSDAEAGRRGPWAATTGPRLRQISQGAVPPPHTGPSPGAGPTVLSPTDGEQEQDPKDYSSDSKGFGSTAV